MTAVQKAAALRDPVLYQTRILGRRLWEKQREIVRSAVTFPLTAVAGCHASGKCVEENEWLTLTDGRRVQARDLVGRVFDIPTLNAAGHVIAAEAIAEWNKVEAVFEVVTESGRRIVRNAAHPLWSAKGKFPAGNRCTIRPIGWTPVANLAPGDLVAVADSLPVFGRQRMPDAELKLLAYLIGDGGYTTNAVTFTQQTNEQLAELRVCADALGCDVKQSPSRPIEYRLTGRADRSRSTIGTNPAINLLRQHGLMKSHSRDKRLPRAVFELTREQVAVFLSRLYSTDGWACVGKHGVCEIGFASASEALISDLMELLLRFGICGRIQPKPATNSWTLAINASSDVLTFCAAIGIFGKEPAVEACRASAARKQETHQRRVWRWKHAPAGTRWERVARITKRPAAQTVAIEVPFHHTFLTTFWEHNTYVATGIIPYHLNRYLDNNKIFTTAPTLRQVTAHWRDIHVAYNESQPLRQMMPPPNVLSWQLGPQRYATGASSSAGVNIAGFHARNVFILADEAPGISGSIWDDIEGLRAGGSVRVLMLGNPVVASGHFYDAFGRNRSIYNCISISAYDTPNFQHPDGRAVTEEELLEMSPEELAYTPFPSLITRSWVRERLIIWGPKHPKYLSRVLGQFPSEDPYSCFPLTWIERARREPTEEEIRLAIRLGWVQVGIDVAGAGSDETTLTARCGGIVLEQHAWPDPDPRGAVLAILQRLRQGRYEWTPTRDEPTAPEWFNRLPKMPLAKIVVDVVSIGYNFAFHLADQGFPVFGFNAGARPIDTMQFVNQKAETYWTFRGYLERNEISNLTDDETGAQLSTLRYRENSKGLTEIEKKEERNKRGIPGSPDRAEGLIEAFMTVRPAQRGEVYSPAGYQISAV